MHVSTRIVSEEPRSLYAGDIVEGTLAAEQVTAGNAEYLPEPEPATEPEPQAEAGVEPESQAELAESAPDPDSTPSEEQ